jgi:hypothetical protein
LNTKKIIDLNCDSRKRTNYLYKDWGYENDKMIRFKKFSKICVFLFTEVKAKRIQSDQENVDLKIRKVFFQTLFSLFLKRSLGSIML